MAANMSAVSLELRQAELMRIGQRWRGGQPEPETLSEPVSPGRAGGSSEVSLVDSVRLRLSRIVPPFTVPDPHGVTVFNSIELTHRVRVFLQQPSLLEGRDDAGDLTDSPGATPESLRGNPGGRQVQRVQAESADDLLGQMRVAWSAVRSLSQGEDAFRDGLGGPTHSPGGSQLLSPTTANAVQARSLELAAVAGKARAAGADPAALIAAMTKGDRLSGGSPASVLVGPEVEPEPPPRPSTGAGGEILRHRSAAALLASPAGGDSGGRLPSGGQAGLQSAERRQLAGVAAANRSRNAIWLREIFDTFRAKASGAEGQPGVAADGQWTWADGTGPVDNGQLAVAVAEAAMLDALGTGADLVRRENICRQFPLPCLVCVFHCLPLPETARLHSVHRLFTGAPPESGGPEAAIFVALADRLTELGGLMQKDIFRAQGEASAVGRLQQALADGQDPATVLAGCEDVHCIAMLMQRWLRELDPSLIPEQLHARWDEVGSGLRRSLSASELEFVGANSPLRTAARKDVAAVAALVASVPEPSQTILRQLVGLLQRVDPKATRMDPANLGLLFATSLIRR